MATMTSKVDDGKGDRANLVRCCKYLKVAQALAPVLSQFDGN